MRKHGVLILAVSILAGCASSTGTGGDIARPKPMQTCEPIDDAMIAGLFERWNTSLKTGDPKAVVDNYAQHSILLPTVSAKIRITQAEKEDYFKHFLANKPVGVVTARYTDIGCNMATDSGLYTFHMGSTGQEVHARYTYTYKWENGQWLITNHHSSLVPQD